MSDKEKKKWNYKEGEGRYGWFDDYLYPGEHHGQVSHRAAVAKNRINKVANDTGLKRESVKHQYDIHKYDDQPGEPTATSTRAQQKNVDKKNNTRRVLEQAFQSSEREYEARRKEINQRNLDNYERRRNQMDNTMNQRNQRQFETTRKSIQNSRKDEQFSEYVKSRKKR